MIHEQMAERIIGCAMKVANTLRCGFLEKVYESALTLELKMAGFSVQPQVAVPVFYGDVLVGDYVADIVVEGTVLLERKAISAFYKIHTAQCINCLKATTKDLCRLFNFGKPRLECKRIISTDLPQT